MSNKPVIFLSYGKHNVSPGRQDIIRHDLIKKALGILNKSITEVEFVSNHNCEGEPEDGRLYYLGEAIKLMDKCDMVIFAKDWQRHKGCVIEHAVAKEYGIEILNE